MTIVKSNMAGTVWKIVVAEGQEIAEGQDIVILESMKMEIPIAAEKSGTVKQIFVQEGDFINEEDQILVVE